MRKQFDFHAQIGRREDMVTGVLTCPWPHCHTGGLESLCVLLPLLSQIHRHTGG